MNYGLRTELGGSVPSGRGSALLSLLHLSDAHVLDSVSPARCEWVELLAAEARWRPLLHMHRPYEALTHWALAAHVEAVRQRPVAPWSGRPFDLALSTGDNIDNAQVNELHAYLAILAGGRARLSARGGVHDASAELGPGPWPYWCPDAGVADLWKPQGYPALPDFVARAGAPLLSPGLGFDWASLPGNHDFLLQGTALPSATTDALACGSQKNLRRPEGFEPADPMASYLADPAAFSAGGSRQVKALEQRRALDRSEWLRLHVASGAAGYGENHVRSGCADAVIDTEHVRIIMLDSNHPAGFCEGSIGTAQLAWLDHRLAEVEAQQDRFAIIASHHGSVSLTNTHGDDPERKHAAELTAVLHRHRCVLAWLVGHRHLHRIAAHPGPSGGFWEITTGSVIDWPSQLRAVEVLRHDDGQIELVCTLLDHDAPAHSLAHLHHELALRFAGDVAANMQGTALDGNVRLLRP